MTDGKRATAAAAGGAALATIVTLAAQMIAPWEGLRTTPYLDPVGILTVCYGHTGKDIERRKYTPAECMAIMQKDVATHAKALECAGDGYKVREGAAFVSLAYNIGVAGFCRSTAAKRAQAGDYAGACEAMSRHIKAGGKVLQGLVDRRAYERAICEGDWATAEAIAARKGLKGLAQAVAGVRDAEETDAAEAEAAREAALEAVKAPEPEAPAASVPPPASSPSAPIWGILKGCTCSTCN